MNTSQTAHCFTSFHLPFSRCDWFFRAHFMRTQVPEEEHAEKGAKVRFGCVNGRIDPSAKWYREMVKSCYQEVDMGNEKKQG
jgi:hypothetical protein